MDNGSPKPVDPRIGAELEAEVRVLRIDDAPPSPAAAINRGLAAARAPLLGVMIDGARLASPGLLRHAILACRLHPRAIAVTPGFHLGPDMQRTSVVAGYDEREEDALLERVDWTSDGYRLFEISAPAASSAGGWFAPIAESNAIFMHRTLWIELGGYDEAFALPGGGFVNLDAYARACELPDVQVVSLLGEGTFHQVHGGVATNASVAAGIAFRDDYVRIRGRPYETPQPAVVYVGSPSRHALPSVARSAAAAVDGSPSAAEPDVRRRYIDLLKKALLNETALEAEAAYFLARDALETGEPVDELAWLDPRHRAPEHFDRVREARSAGRYFERKPRNVGYAHTMVGRKRLDNVDHCVSRVLADGVAGDLVECGVWRGGVSILMRAMLAAHGIRDRTVWAADSFAGLPKPNPPHDTLDLSADVRPELAVSLERVRENFALYGLLDDQVRFLEGWFADTLPDAPIESIAVLRLDGDLYESTMVALTALYDRVSLDGYVIVDDYNALPDCRAAVDGFRAARAIHDEVVAIDWTGVYWRKTG